MFVRTALFLLDSSSEMSATAESLDDLAYRLIITLYSQPAL